MGEKEFGVMKTNLAELLRDCPTGMELDCTVFDNITFDYVNTEQNRIYCKIDNRDTVWFTAKGCINLAPSAKCVIFPKGKTTWKGFYRPFKDGEILATNNGKYIAIIKKNGGKYYCCCHTNGTYLVIDESGWFDRLATEEEKQKLFDAIKTNGYKWNAETKTLDKLVERKFKIGDKIKKKNSDNVRILEITAITPKTYIFRDGSFQYVEIIDKDYKLVPNKFDITTLKPFDKVLVRNTNTEYWRISLFGAIVHDDRRYFMCLANSGFYQCIPYEGNEHLLGTSDDCDNFYKTWPL